MHTPMEVVTKAIVVFWGSPFATAAIAIVMLLCIYWLAIKLDSVLQKKAMQQLEGFKEEVSSNKKYRMLSQQNCYLVHMYISYSVPSIWM